MIFITEQEYRHIRNLAWDVLLDSGVSSLPIDIQTIASVYHLQHLIDNSKTLFQNTMFVSEGILQIFGLTNPDFVGHLAIRILAPMVLLRELRIKSAREISVLTGLPTSIAHQRFKRYKHLLEIDGFGTSHLETELLLRFRKWLNSYPKP